jgi:hypothetical protein
MFNMAVTVGSLSQDIENHGHLFFMVDEMFAKEAVLRGLLTNALQKSEDVARVW